MARHNITDRIPGLPGRIIRFYIEGFRDMTVGRYLWAMILIKLLIIFGVFKLFFFPDILERDYSSDSERAAAVRRELVRRGTSLPGVIDTLCPTILKFQSLWTI